MNKQKPGDLYNKHQKKKKSVGDQPSMAGWKPVVGGFAYPKPVTPKVAASKSPVAPKAMAKKKKNWIAGAIKKPGALHAELGIKQGNKIPAKTLARAAKKPGKEGKRARLAETLKSFHKKMDSSKHCKSCKC